MVTGARAGAMLAGNTGKPLIRKTLALSALILLLSVPAGATAEKAAAESVEDVEMRGIIGEACFGDRYESDEDMNDGNRITQEEILQLLNPPRS